MAGSTVNFGLGFFDFGNPLGTDFAGQVEIDRFIIIDKQIFGMMSIFGNGVISGWQIAAIGPMDIEVSPGYGNINYIAGRTQLSFQINGLTPNATIYIYARIRDAVSWTEDVDFFASTTRYVTSANTLLLATVETGPEAITAVDNTVRTEIGFLQIILDAIAKHHHRGGTSNPSKIDLTSEVRGQLPALHIAPFDAEKIDTGTFMASVMPLLNHSDLTNVGLATHPQLDTFVRTLKTSNKELFGEIGTANLLQFILATKFLYEDPSSPLYANRLVDRTFINELAVIPGITPNSYIDFENSNAVIDLDKHEVRGVPAVTGNSFYAKWDSALAWSSGSMQNLVIVGTDLTLGFSDEQASVVTPIEDFEGVINWNVAVAPVSGGGAVDPETVVGYVGAGNQSGEFDTATIFEMTYTKEFSSPQDWSDYDRMSYMVKCTDAIHGIVRMRIATSSGDFEVPAPILEEDEATSNPENYDFETRTVDLSAIPDRTSISKIVLYHRDLTSGFKFFVDQIQIMRDVLLPEEGSIRLRYSSSSQVTFSQVDWLSIEPTGTTIEVRARAASDGSLLSRAEWTEYLTNGAVVNLRGSDLEIEINFYPDAERRLAPTLDWLRVLINSVGEIDGYNLDTEEEFARGTADNVRIQPYPTISLQTPLYVGSYYFILGGAINQYYQQLATAELSWFGTDSPVHPNQIVRSVESGSGVSPSFFEPRSVERTFNRTYVVADTYNDRILEYDEDGNLLSGFGCINWTHNGEKPFPVASSIDPRSGILYVIWSQKVSFDQVNVSKMRVQDLGGSKEITLIRDLDLVENLATSELSGREGQVMRVYLTPQNTAVAQRMPSLTTYLSVDNDVLPSGILSGGVSRICDTALTVRGLRCYIGNFIYIESGVINPTGVSRNGSTTYVITNAKVAVPVIDLPDPPSGYTKDDLTYSDTTPSFVEVDKNGELLFADDSVMQFSPFIPGGLRAVSTDRYLVGGIRAGTGESGEPQEGRKFDFRVIRGTYEEKGIQRQTLKDVMLSDGKEFKGRVVLYDKANKLVLFQYDCPEGLFASDVDIDSVGNYVVAESSFDTAGRVIKIDSLGNIIFSYGEGSYSLINDIDVQEDGAILISS